jgi:adenylyltransferase/sulfurtransferase
VENDARFSRQRNIPFLDAAQQQQWSKKKILILGCGGLGNGVLMSLARMGFADFVLIDGDKVEISNLHRQWMFSEDQLGIPKVKAAEAWLKCFASKSKCLTIDQFVSTHFDESSIPDDIDVVLDCTDQISAKYWIEGFCKRKNIPWVMGSVEQWEGQVSVFEYPDENGIKWSYSQWVGAGLKDYMVGSCEQRGVFPPVVQWIAQMQVLETCRICNSLPVAFSGKIGYWNMWTNTHLSVQLRGV